MRDLLVQYIGGGWGKEAADATHMVPGYVIRGTDLPALRVGQYDGVPYRFHKASNYRSRQLQPYDIVFEVSGGSKDQPVGRAALVKPEMLAAFDQKAICASFCKLLRANTKVADPKFLFFFLESIYHNRHITRYQVQSTGISNFQFETFLDEQDVCLPPLDLQRKIAEVLSAYDDLIVNNTRRIQILEEMAQAIYREWFVNFRFPGHEQVETVDSDLGEIPARWEITSVGACASYINRGIAPKYDDNAVSIAINQRCIREGKIDLGLARRQSKAVPKDKQVQFGDVLVNSTGVGTLGRVAQVYQEIPNCTVDTHVSLVRPGPRLNIDFWGLALLALEPQFTALGFGSTGQTELRRDSIADVHLVLPPLGVQDTFSDIVAPMRRSLNNLLSRNANLRNTRDLLLPRLISGEIDVEDLDIQTGELAA